MLIQKCNGTALRVPLVATRIAWGRRSACFVTRVSIILYVDPTRRVRVRSAPLGDSLAEKVPLLARHVAETRIPIRRCSRGQRVCHARGENPLKARGRMAMALPPPSVLMWKVHATLARRGVEGSAMGVLRELSVPMVCCVSHARPARTARHGIARYAASARRVGTETSRRGLP